ncbi:MAG TPA: diacylglycerol kinase family protein [Rectinemataceae bacterium]|nr:diacylglycerol kinase family protein [Rectinemataceae bacterium]
MLSPEILAEELRHLLSRSPVSPGLSIEVELIANPVAGGFTRPRYAKRRAAELATLKVLSEALPEREGGCSVRLHRTDRAGHAANIAREIFAEAGRAGARPALRVLVTAGGDGTALEVASALMELPEEKRNRWLVLRLPLGTGNDGSEGRDLGVALGRFLGPCVAEPRAAILISPNPSGGKPPQWAFNIASVGADAFIAHMTNRLKTRFPGDSYKTMVDLAAVIYDLRWPSMPATIRSWHEGAGERLIEGDCLLLAMGASGHRTYGSNKKILPGQDNVCFIPRMSLLGKLAIKGPISAGEHVKFREVQLFSADRLVVEYPGPLLFQADGEVTRLEVADFPLELQRIEGAYRVLGPAATP